jgi:hypothetical protein
MTLQLQLDPASEAALQEKATRRGVSPEQYVKALVDEDIHVPSDSSQASAGGLDDLFAKLHEWGKGLPDLPDSAITRDSFYERDEA